MKRVTLKNIILPVRDELEGFEHEYRKTLRSKVPLINTIMDYILSQKSKKVRPLMVLLSAKLCGTPNSRSYIAASLVEILHTATLVHDDIIDGAELRRGEPSVKAMWQNKVAVLIGDFLFSKTLINLVRLENYNAIRLLSETTELLSSGELWQIDRKADEDLAESEYLDMIWAKTASLFATSCQLGALSVDEQSGAGEALYEYGKNFGLAFQIKDDLLDLVGNEQTVGKPVGVDLKEQTVTLPLIYAMQNFSTKEKSKFKALFYQDAGFEQIKELRELIIQSGAVKETERKLETISVQAHQALADFADCPAKQALNDFVRFNLERVH
jgi:octaprenyl-diphosphate synthase